MVYNIEEPSLWFADCAQQIREVKQAMTSTYLIPKEHFAIMADERGLCVAILVAMTDDNAAIIEHEMEGQGFRIASPTDMILHRRQATATMDGNTLCASSPRRCDI